MTTTITPSAGHGPWTQQGVGTSPGYDAIDVRRLTVGVQEGVIDAGSYEVTQRGAGANMSVDIAASTGDGALVLGDAISVQGLYRVAPHSAVINETITAAHATLPRIDQVVLELKDTQHDASGSNLAQTRVVAGTATSGATLDNRTGAAALPSSALLLADVLIAATDTSISNSEIRDRRKWARGAYSRIVRNANAAAGSDYTPNATTFALLDATNLAPRIECSGVPVRVSLSCQITGAATDQLRVSPQVDSLGVDGMGDVGETAGVAGELNHILASTGPEHNVFEWTFVPAAGSHIIAPGCSKTGTVLIRARAGYPLVWTVEEIVRQNTKNNATTTG